MTHLRDATRTVVDALRAANIRATDDPRNVTPPCVWVEFAGSTRLTTSRVATVVQASLIVPGPGNLDALAALDALADRVFPALDDAALLWTATDLGMTASPSTGDPLPSWTLTITRTTEV